LGLDTTITRVVDVATVDVATARERFGKEAGGFIPYLFILFSLLGSMYPAIDLGAGEKERGTLETLLTAPVGRLEILFGKFAVVVLSGLTSAAVSILGMWVGVRQAADIPQEILDLVAAIFKPVSIALLLSLLLPLTIFFAGVLLTISFLARSFREAQSKISPLMMLVILPAAIGMTPGIVLDAKTALIPILNVSLAVKEILSGTASAPLLAEVYASLVVLAAASLVGCARWFGREESIFRV